MATGSWEVKCDEDGNRVLVHAQGKVIGHVNRRAAAILGPLLQGGLIDVHIQQNQEAGGQTGKALYIFAKVGTAGNHQVSGAKASLIFGSLPLYTKPKTDLSYS